jgi:PadR family transcriptional regulator, regulatory protein PadR
MIYCTTVYQEHDAVSLEKELMKGWVEVALLAMLAAEPDYGYRLLMRMRQAGGCDLCPRPGNVYPILHRLARRKWVTVKTSRAAGTRRRRRFYRLTARGRRALKDASVHCRRMAACMNALLDTAVP